MSFQDVHIDAPGVDDASAGELGADIASGEAYAVKLPVFEGPLDLLLHLIRQNEVDVTDIPIAEIAAQYLSYLEVMQDLNLDVAGEYLVMAATLALIKSRMLLPSIGEDEPEDGIDPRAELVARLLEYQRYKEVAEQLGVRRLLGRDVFAAQGAGLDPVPEGAREIEVGLFELIDAFRLVLENAPGPGDVHQIESEAISVRDCMISVMERLDAVESIEFNQIFEAPGGALPSRALVVATFLAILELARLVALSVYQGCGESGAPEGPIRLRGAQPLTADAGPSWRERISDLM